MAVKQNSTFVGLEYRDLRPGRDVLMSQLEEVAGDQAAVYEAITGQKIPDASTISATPHVHDGTDGEVIPLPLACGGPKATLSALATTNDKYQPVLHFPLFIPTGVSQVKFVGLSSGGEVAHFAQAGLTTNADGGFPSTQYETKKIDEVTGWTLWEMTLDVASEGAINVFRLEVWNGADDPDGNTPITGARSLEGWCIYPIQAKIAPFTADEPIVALPYVAPSVTDTSVRLPSGTQHLGSDAYTSFDQNRFTNKRSVDGHMLQGFALNDALNWELASGLPAGGNAEGHSNVNGGGSISHAGHTHGGEADLENTGALIEQPLGAWALGVRRAPVASSGHFESDMESPPEYAWQGQIMAPCPRTDLSIVNVGEMLFRLPALDAQHALDTVGGATTKIVGTILLYNGVFDEVNVSTLYFTIKNISGGSAGTAVSVSVPASTGFHLITMPEMDASGDPGSTGLEQRVLISVDQGGKTFPKLAILGACIHLKT